MENLVKYISKCVAVLDSAKENWCFAISRLVLCDVISENVRRLKPSG